MWYDPKEGLEKQLQLSPVFWLTKTTHAPFLRVPSKWLHSCISINMWTTPLLFPSKILAMENMQKHFSASFYRKPILGGCLPFRVPAAFHCFSGMENLCSLIWPIQFRSDEMGRFSILKLLIHAQLLLFLSCTHPKQFLATGWVFWTQK